MPTNTAEEDLVEGEDLRQELKGDHIIFIEISDGWTERRDNLAQRMWNAHHYLFL